MTPQELKNSILQLAIQGRLVEQRPEEGTAEELYQLIQMEKQKLIQQGRIKKEKSLLEITEDEKPFDIPESWKWVRLGDCSSYAQTKEKVTPADINPNDWSLDLEDVEKNTGEIINYCKASERKITGDKVVFHKNQVLYSKLRPYLKKILVSPDDGICTPELVPFSPYGEIAPEYLVIVLKSPHVDYVINSVTYGVKMPRVGTETMVNLLIPLPPLAEQKRIVAKIEELLPLIDRYEKAWNRLEEFNKRFPDDLQKSLLQMAIQGKLVEQQAEEGTGEELYQQIQEEKQKLIKEGKIKKDKPTSEITEDDKPFDIPDSWKWIRLADAVYIRGGKRLPKGEKLLETPTSHIYIRVTDMQNGTILDNDLHYISESVFSQISQYIISRNDVYIVIVGSTIGKVGLVPDMFDGMNLTENAARMIPILIDRVFLYYLLTSKSIQRQFIDNTKQVGQPKLALFRLESTCIPLPPLAEQRRIVAKLEELLPLCEKLKQ